MDHKKEIEPILTQALLNSINECLNADRGRLNDAEYPKALLTQVTEVIKVLYSTLPRRISEEIKQYREWNELADRILRKGQKKWHP